MIYRVMRHGSAYLFDRDSWVRAADWQAAPPFWWGGRTTCQPDEQQIDLTSTGGADPYLDAGSRQRLIRLAGDRCHHGILVIQADEHREQIRNRQSLSDACGSWCGVHLLCPSSAGRLSQLG